MRRFRLGLLLAALSISASTNAATVSSNTMPGVNFGAYQTFAWVDTRPPAGMDPVVYAQMRQAIEGALAGKGYTKADAGDLSLILTVGKQDKTDIQTWGRWGLQTDVYQYTQGKMSLDAFDTKTRQPVWHGSAAETINPNKPNMSKITSAITKVMSQFPARQ